MGTREVAAAQNSSWQMIEQGGLDPAAGQAWQTSVSIAARERWGPRSQWEGETAASAEDCVSSLSVKGKADKVQ